MVGHTPRRPPKGDAVCSQMLQGSGGRGVSRNDHLGKMCRTATRPGTRDRCKCTILDHCRCGIMCKPCGTWGSWGHIPQRPTGRDAIHHKSLEVAQHGGQVVERGGGHPATGDRWKGTSLLNYLGGMPCSKRQHDMGHRYGHLREEARYCHTARLTGQVCF